MHTKKLCFGIILSQLVSSFTLFCYFRSLSFLKAKDIMKIRDLKLNFNNEVEKWM